MRSILLTGLPSTVLAFALGVQAASPPVVSNVSASQRSGTKLVDIHFSVTDADGDAQLIQVLVSGDGGATYTIPCTTLSGDIGPGVSPGLNKHIVWNAGADWNGQFVANTKVRITASDGTFPAPPPGMVLIPGGSFQMGDSFGEHGPQNLPLHNVTVSSFFMDRFEVTGELYTSVKAWGAGHGYDLPPGPSQGVGHPTQQINWYYAVKWCNARSEMEGLTPVYYTDDAQTLVYRSSSLDLTNSKVKWNANGYRLPTEAEWEKAARGGLHGLRYPWGNTLSNNQANFFNSGDPFATTAPVGYYNGSQIPTGSDMANGFGLYDMAGNMQEWCWDRWSSTYYSDPSATLDPKGPETGTNRVWRGGSWDGATFWLSVGCRDSNGPATNLNYVGFRTVRKAP